MKPLPKLQLLGSSPTFEGIQDVIAAFYCGERKQLRPVGECETLWTVHKADGTELSTLVSLEKGRYRFQGPPK